MNSSKQH